VLYRLKDEVQVLYGEQSIELDKGVDKFQVRANQANVFARVLDREPCKFYKFIYIKKKYLDDIQVPPNNYRLPSLHIEISGSGQVGLHYWLAKQASITATLVVDSSFYYPMVILFTFSLFIFNV
jgi:hypothetical protein